MRKDYPKGMRVKVLNPRRSAGEIIDTMTFFYDSREVFRYIIRFDDGSEARMDWNDVAPEDHPWHAQMDKWLAEGRAKGFTHIFIGTDEVNRKYKAFFGYNYGHVEKLRKEHPELLFNKYWVM